MGKSVVVRVVPGGGRILKRASLAPQPVLPEIDHKIKQKALTVSGEMDAQTTLDDCGGGVHGRGGRRCVATEPSGDNKLNRR
eukprot:COSAG01_NODE_14675_length_1423_cov_0.677492_1_plen_82_part_00